MERRRPIRPHQPRREAERSSGTPAATVAHEHDEEGWAPADGFERFAFNVLANIFSGFGFALILVAVSEFAGGISSWRSGMLWGFAGFAVFTLAPGLGPAAGTAGHARRRPLPRQIWWIATVVATSAGLWLVAFRGTVLLSIVGVALIVAPHVVGAPQPDSHEIAHSRRSPSPVRGGLDGDQPGFLVLLGGLVGLVRSAVHGSRGTASQPACLREHYAVAR